MANDDDPKFTEADLVEIEQRLSAATAGPWCYRHGFIETAYEPNLLLGVTMQRNEAGLEPLPGACNGEFIAAARNDVARLVAEVRRLRSALRELEERLGAAS